MLAVYNPTQVHCILTLGQILSISIYIQWGNQHEVPFGKRAISIPRSGGSREDQEYIKRVQEESAEREGTLVMGKLPSMVRVKLLFSAKFWCQ
jgi:hypothetical protein